MSRGYKWDLPFDRMTTKLDILQVLEIQYFEPLVIGNEVRHLMAGALQGRFSAAEKPLCGASAIRFLARASE
jgi:hypothetical protein